MATLPPANQFLALVSSSSLHLGARHDVPGDRTTEYRFFFAFSTWRNVHQLRLPCQVKNIDFLKDNAHV
jgi:hypothetical protein